MSNNFTYVARPVYVEAFQYSKLESGNTIAIPQWLIQAILMGTIKAAATTEELAQCNTKQGWVAINPSDMLIRLEDGEIYPCSIEVFNKKYEAVPAAAEK